MQLTGGEFDVIVIGSGRSGRETALAATREGCSTLLISLSPGTIASMMWSTSDESPLKQELIQAFIPSGCANENKKEHPMVTIQTTLHQPDREAPLYVLQAQVQRNQHTLPGSDEAVHIKEESKPASSGQNKSLREREMRIRERMIRRNNHLPEPEARKESATEKSEVETTSRKRTSSIYKQRNNYLRKKLLDRPGVREKQIPTESKRKEEIRGVTKGDSANAVETDSPLLLPSMKDKKEFSEALVHIDRDRTRRKKQRATGTAKVRPLIYRDSQVKEKKPVKNRFQSLVWENSKEGSTTARKETRLKGHPKTSKIKFVDEGLENKDSRKESGLHYPPPEARPEPDHSKIVRQRNKFAHPDSERENKKISFIEREQARKILEQSSNPLKREAIQLEDPYGYNAWEDIMPFSKGKQSTSELDASEKRQLALRGLRNLINNLG